VTDVAVAFPAKGSPTCNGRGPRETAFLSQLQWYDTLLCKLAYSLGEPVTQLLVACLKYCLSYSQKVLAL